MNAAQTKSAQKRKRTMRPLWSGAISFGLINIPVKLFSATQERTIDLDMLRKGDLCPIRYARVCRATGEEVAYKDIVKGYEYEKGDYVVLTDEDIKSASPRKTQTIDIVAFVEEDEIESQYFERPFFVEPSKGAQKAYALLREALRKTKKVALARFVLKTKEHLAVLKADEDMLILNEIRFESELKQPEGLNVPGEKASGKELDMAIKLIEQLTEPFKPEDFHDTYTDQLKKTIEKKAKGELKSVKTPEVEATDVDDLMASLKASLERARGKDESPHTHASA